VASTGSRRHKRHSQQHTQDDGDDDDDDEYNDANDGVVLNAGVLLMSQIRRCERASEGTF
jgi:hypothetical protein